MITALEILGIIALSLFILHTIARIIVVVIKAIFTALHKSGL